MTPQSLIAKAESLANHQTDRLVRSVLEGYATRLGYTSPQEWHRAHIKRCGGVCWYCQSVARYVDIKVRFHRMSQEAAERLDDSGVQSQRTHKDRMRERAMNEEGVYVWSNP